MQDLSTRTQAFALRIIRLYTALSKSYEAQVIGKQLLRSGTSVGAQYRESIRARSSAEFVAKIHIGLQELEESLYWLELLMLAKIYTEAQLAGIIQETKELIAILITISKKAQVKAK